MNNKVKKIIPSKLETGFQQFLYRTIGKRIPKKVTPNQITVMGALGGLCGIVFAALAKVHVLFLIGTICGLLCHLICDDLDGYVARTRNMSSTSGGYLDLITDILHITYLIIALAFAGVVSFPVAIFLVPVYGLLMFTAMNYILHLNEFLFPKLGPIETHLLLVAVCVGSMIWGTEPLFCAGSFGVRFGDCVFAVGGVAVYWEMIRLQIQLFKRLRGKEKDEATG